MKIRLKLLLFILFFVLLYAFYYWGIPACINLKTRTSEIEHLIKKEMGLQVKFENPDLKMGLVPSVWLSSSYFKIENEDEEPLSIVNPKLKIRLFPLFFGKIHLAYFSCDKINAKLKMDKNYRFYIGNQLIIKNANPKISVENAQMDVESYDINFKDESQSKNILLRGDYFNLEKYNSQKYIKFSTNSKLKINENYSTINMDVNFELPLKKGFATNDIVFDGTVTNLNLGDLSPYIKKISKNEIKKTVGILNIQTDTKVLNRKITQIKTQMVLDNLSIIANDKISLSLQDKLNLNAIVDVAKNSVKIKEFNIISGKINTNITGKINKISSSNPILNLSVLVKKSRIEDFISLLPAKNFKDIDINFVALKKYGYYGNIEGNIFVKGKYEKPEITGEILSTEGYVIKPLNIPKATVKLKFLKDKFDIDVMVPVGNNQKVLVKGPVDLYGDKKALLDISSTDNVDLKTTEFILNPLHEIFAFDIGPLPVMQLEGKGNIKLKTSGNKKNPSLTGVFNFKNTSARFNGINMLLNNGSGSLYFENTNTHFITNKAFLDSKPIKIDGKCSLKGELDFDITANNQNLDFLLNILKTSANLVSMKNAIPAIEKADGKINLTLKLKGKAQTVNDFVLCKTVVASGTIKLLGNNILFGGLQIPLKNLFGNIKFHNTDVNFDLYSIVDKTKIYIKGKIRNNILSLKMKLNNIAFQYADIPVKIFSGNLEINNNKLILYKVNAMLDSMPFLIDGFITDIFKNPHFNIYINSKPTQKFIDKYINKKSLYPLKMRGDIIYSARMRGTKDLFNAQAEINLQEDSYIYYMGSMIGDLNNPIRIFLDTNVAKNSVYVNNFQYDKLISSQNDKEFVLHQLNAKGEVTFYPDNINLSNFKIKTQNPTDAKIFNILFKKPLIKQGLFNSNIIINNSISSPKLLGFLNFTGIDIPLLDTTIKDISLNFSQNNIDIKSKGEIFSNQIIFFSNMENRLIPPYVFSDVDIYLGNLDINEIVKSLNKLDIESDMNKISGQKQEFDITNVIVKNAKLKADSIFVKNIFAKDLTAEFSLNEKMLFSFDNFKFNIAGGNVEGNFKYNLLNSNSSLQLNVDKVNANSMSEALFDLPNQIFGSLTGQADLTCNGNTHKTCMDTLSGSGGFRVADGRMPKLGSLEYLLKAANLVKSGVTGLTINGIIDLVTPLKTGQFETINGSFSINSGIADSIEIFSKGKDLSLFLTGKYNFSTLVADMKVFGRISKKISNILGPVGNTSLNTLFNTIPGLNLDENNKAEFVKNLDKVPGFELNDKSYRIFSAEIYGDINGENYVQSFKWID